MTTNHYDLELEQLEERATGQLTTAEVFDVAAFDKLYEYIAGKAYELRDEYVLSKQILSCLRQASATIRSRAQYLPAVREQIGTAAKFEILLDLLIAGEIPSDREPGVPRII